MKAFRQLLRMVNKKDPDHPVQFLFVLVDVTRELPWGAGGVDDKHRLAFQLCHQLWADLGPVA